MTTQVANPVVSDAPLRVVRMLSAAMAVIVVVDAVSVGAPGLGLLAVPFLVAALRFRRATTWGSALLVGWCCFYVAIGVNYAMANGFDADWGDLLFAYVGTPVAAVLGVLTVRAARSARQAT